MHHVLDGYGTDADDHQAGRHHRAVVPAGGQPRRLRLHLHRGQPAVAQEPARQQRRRPDHRRATASTSTATSPRSGATTTRARRPTRRARPTAAPGPNSEPETKALDALFRRVGFEFLVNYHSAAELLLYGVGWQVETPSPDDQITRRWPVTTRTRRCPATTRTSPPSSTPPTATPTPTPRCATARSASRRRCRTCQTASAIDPDDQWDPADCESGFNFPDDEKLIAGRVRQEHPVRAVGRPVGQGPGQPGLGGRPHARPTWSSDAFDGLVRLDASRSP